MMFLTQQLQYKLRWPPFASGKDSKNNNLYNATVLHCSIGVIVDRGHNKHRITESFFATKFPF